MSMVRIVFPELLDDMGVQDPSAQRSRRDLRRLHQIMGTKKILLEALRKMPLNNSISPSVPPLQVLELGAGDASLMAGVARGLQVEWPKVSLTLLDQHNLLEPTTAANYARAGWRVTVQVSDVLAWAKSGSGPGVAPSTRRWDLIVSNLFLHHFEDPQLRLIFDAVIARADNFFACEPQRAWLAWAGSHLVGAVGANAVTRHDAVVSVQAGFRNKELSSLWPDTANDWTLKEYPAGLFSHCFFATRKIGSIAS